MPDNIPIFKNELCKRTLHFVNDLEMFSSYPEGTEQVLLGMGCFWGAERIFWRLDGVHVTSVGFSGGYTTDPDYEKTCTGKTGHVETVHVVDDPKAISFDEILKVFFVNHDPTQGERQGADIGPQYRSAIFTYTDEQAFYAAQAMLRYQEAYGRPVTTELLDASTYYAAEDYHQQYLAKNPEGYCMHGPTGVVCHLPDR